MPIRQPVAFSEFDIIAEYFATGGARRDDVALGVGDDCALLRVPAGQELAATVDTLVEGVHFHAGADPGDLGYKALAVNLSDLAAMGAEPAWATLALTLPHPERGWLAAFSQGLLGLAREHDVQLVGGDTTRGPLSVTLQAQGFVPPGEALRRSGARPGDLIYVTGCLGDAGLALLAAQGLYVMSGSLPYLRGRLHRPTPRIAPGLVLRGLATSAIDLSDGLGADLHHVLAASGVGATVQVAQLPLSEAVRGYVQETGDWGLPLGAGDDYELCFTIPERRQGEFEALAADWDCGCAWIGMIEALPGLRCALADGSLVEAGGWDHFGNDDD